MQNHLKKIAVYSLFICLSSACTTSNKRGFSDIGIKPQEFSLTAPITLKIQANKGDVYMHEYHVSSLTKTYEKGSLRKEQEEVIDFTVRQKVLDIRKNQSLNLVEVLEKDGIMDLHDLVMPYVGEKLHIALNAQGKVLAAGNYKKDSAFFLSPISFPKNPVVLGDTWVLNESWVNETSGMPMKIELVSILKNIYQYGENTFAELETSGQVLIPKLIEKQVDFRSEVIGRILVNTRNGNVVWSEIRNKEKIQYPEFMVKVISCMELRAIPPTEVVWPWAKKPACDPRKEFIYTIPGN